jgi:hypothetical protein
MLQSLSRIRTSNTGSPLHLETNLAVLADYRDPAVYCHAVSHNKLDNQYRLIHFNTLTLPFLN